MSSDRVDRFGFFACDWVLDVPGVRVEPLAGLAPRWERLRDRPTRVTTVAGDRRARVSFRNGYLHPSLPPDEHIWKLPPKLAPSHVIRLSGQHASGTPRAGADAFVVNLLACLFGVRLQFERWWLDGRVAVELRKTSWASFGPRGQEVVADFLGRALATWSGWPAEIQTRFTETLYVHTRLPMYHWPFERFVFEYAVTDALWKIAETLWRWKAKRHEDRLTMLREKFELWNAPEMLAEFARLRNDLVHEARWDRAMLGRGGERAVSELVPDHLRRFNHRLVAAMLGYKNGYVGSNWTSISKNQPFEKAS